MQFEVLIEYQIGIFYQLTIDDRSGYVLYLTQRVGVESVLVARPYELTSHLSTGFQVGSLTEGDSSAFVGFLFYSKLPMLCYGTGAMSYSLAWQRSSPDHKVLSEQASLVFRNEYFYMYEVPTIATLITGVEVNEDLDSFLTMI